MLSVYQAETSDYNFIYPQVIRAAKHKHFLLDPAYKEERDYLKRNLKSVLSTGKMENGLCGQPLIFQHEGTNIGFALISEIKPGHGGNEIHLFLVHHQYQQQGFGAAMLDEINRRWQSVDLYARCFPASQTMQNMLQRRGFVYTHTNSEGASVLLRQRIDL